MEKNVWKEGVWRQRVRTEKIPSVEGIGKEGKAIGSSKCGYSTDSWKAYIRYLDTELREAYPAQFLGTVSRTEEDRKSGFLPPGGESVWIELCEEEAHIGRHICDAKQGIWILQDGSIQRYLYLSYTLGTYWVISLPEHVMELVSCISAILRATDPKYVLFPDNTVGIWRDVYSWEDVVLVGRMG